MAFGVCNVRIAGPAHDAAPGCCDCPVTHGRPGMDRRTRSPSVGTRAPTGLRAVRFSGDFVAIAPPKTA